MMLAGRQTRDRPRRTSTSAGRRCQTESNCKGAMSKAGVDKHKTDRDKVLLVGKLAGGVTWWCGENVVKSMTLMRRKRVWIKVGGCQCEASHCLRRLLFCFRGTSRPLLMLRPPIRIGRGARGRAGTCARAKDAWGKEEGGGRGRQRPRGGPRALQCPGRSAPGDPRDRRRHANAQTVLMGFIGVNKEILHLLETSRT